MDLRDVLKTRRAALGISQRDLAEMADVSVATVKDIERGKANPSLKTVMSLLEILGMEISYSLRNTDR